MLAAMNVFRRRIRLKSLRPSFKQNLLRIPGGSLLRRLDNLNEQINLYLVYVIILPLIIYSTLISYSYFQAEQPSLTVVWISSIICLALIAYLIFNLVQLLSQRKRIRLGYEGELAVGQELNQLMLHGYRVYHDFPADTFNIDHIIVGSKGVFAVETRTRSKGAARKSGQEATVTYDGRMLTYADTTDFETIEQAEAASCLAVQMACRCYRRADSGQGHRYPSRLGGKKNICRRDPGGQPRAICLPVRAYKATTPVGNNAKLYQGSTRTKMPQHGTGLNNRLNGSR